MVDKKHTLSVVTTVLETLQTLTVSQTTPADSGVYKAVATNIAGDALTQATVTINGKQPASNYICLSFMCIFQRPSYSYYLKYHVLSVCGKCWSAD